MCLFVFKPNRKLFAEKESSWPLIVILVPYAEAGNWAYQVTVLDIPKNNYLYLVSIGTQDSLEIKLPMGISFISFPIHAFCGDPSVVLGIPNVNIARWVKAFQEDQPTYHFRDLYAFLTPIDAAFPEGTVENLHAGLGYWIKLSQDRKVAIQGQRIPQDKPYRIKLHIGWNAIGNPFESTVPWDIDNIKAVKEGQELILNAAQAAGWIEDYAWGWEQDENDPFKGRYVLVYDTSIIPGVQGYLEPWKGYWVYAHQDCELILPPPSQNKGRGTRNAGQTEKSNGWAMKLVAKVGDESGEAILGVSQGSRGLAIGLPPEPPEGSNNVQVILLNNAAPLAVDVRNSIRQRQEWDVVVKFGTRSGGRGTRQNKEVTLTFDGVGYAPKDMSLWLVDMVTGKRLYMRTQSVYWFVPNEGETSRKFKVIAELGNERPLQVVGLKAIPMWGRSLAIRFALTKPAQTQVEVMTLTGRKVAVLESGVSRKAGQQQIVWQGRGNSGELLPAKFLPDPSYRN